MRACAGWPMTATFSYEGRRLPSNSSESDEKAQQQHKSSVKGMPPKKPGGKNKRGERGSTDDEIADPKRVNMASADFKPADVV